MHVIPIVANNNFLHTAKAYTRLNRMITKECNFKNSQNLLMQEIPCDPNILELIIIIPKKKTILQAITIFHHTWRKFSHTVESPTNFLSQWP